jgi:acyl-CoA thioesterase
VGDLAVDTSLRRVSDDAFEAVVGSEWDAFGPNGGFLSAIALRAAGEVSAFTMPVIFQGQYGRPARPTAAVVRTQTIVRTARTEVVRVDITQNGPVLSAFVRTVSPDTGSPSSELEHDYAPAPDVPPPDLLRPLEQLLPPGSVQLPIASNFEMRPITWETTWPPRQARPARNLAWIRFRPAATFADPFIDHGRSLTIADMEVWRAVMRAHGGCPSHTGRSIDLTVTFHRPVTDQEWLLSEVVSPVATHGIVSGQARIWCASGELVASGMSNMVARALPAGALPAPY